MKEWKNGRPLKGLFETDTDCGALVLSRTHLDACAMLVEDCLGECQADSMACYAARIGGAVEGLKDMGHVI